MEFFTIGVYHTSEKAFFEKLIANNIDTFCDIRQRRGVRGAQYAFVNSNRLQVALKKLGIKYVYERNLAPTSEIRELQKLADQERGEAKRDRTTLGKVFVSEYEKQVLADYKFSSFLKRLSDIGAKRVVFFCVEERADACHRSLVTDKLSQLYSYEITHL